MANGSVVKSEVEIINYKVVDKGNFKAMFSVVAHGTSIHECRLIQQPGQKWFISGPQRMWEKDGKKNYVPLVNFSDAFRARIETAVRPLFEVRVEEDFGVEDIPF